ncbi:MAG: hypothetical protein MUF45_10995 [Spirosomaceae bacterium]|jgi:hypothetical protein|nr:hypothetical protein [Spirosomataceae bacterium]
MELSEFVRPRNGTELVEILLETKRNAQKETREQSKSNTELKLAFEKLKKKNEQRGTPIISL